MHGFTNYYPANAEGTIILNPLSPIKNGYFDALRTEIEHYIPEETEMKIVKLLDQR